MLVECAESTLRSRLLGSKLREWLHRRGMSVEVAACHLDTDPDAVELLLNGQRRDPADVAGILALCRVRVDERRTAMRIAVDPFTRSWFELAHHTQPPGWDMLAHAERTAHRITTYHPLLVPELVRLPDYTHTVVAPTTPPELVERHLDLLQARQTILREPTSPSVRVLIPRRALRALSSDTAESEQVMAEQTRHLLTLSHLPHVEIRVLPTDAGLVTTCEAFTMYEFTASPPVVSLPQLDHLIVLEEPGAVAGYQHLLAALLGAAITPEHSRTWLTAPRDVRNGA